MSWTADQLLEGIKARISMVSSQSLLSNSKILAFADKITESIVVPLIMRTRGNFLVMSHTEDLVADTSEYDVHYRAVGRASRELQILDEDDNVICDLPLIPLEDAHRYQNRTNGGWGMHFRGDKIVILPTPATGVTEQLRQYFYLKPSRYVTSSEARQVTAKTATTVTLSGSTLPDAFVADATIDFIQAKSGCSLLAMDKTITQVSGQTLTFAAGVVPSALVVGDWIAQSYKSPVIMLPDEAYDLLEALTAKRCLVAKSDFEGASQIDPDIKMAREGMLEALTPRQKGEPEVIVHSHGLLSGRRQGRFGVFSRISES